MISTHTSTNAANGIMTNHSISVFLEIVNETIRNAINLEDTAGDYYSSNPGSSDEDRVCFGVRLRQPASQPSKDASITAKWPNGTFNHPIFSLILSTLGISQSRCLFPTILMD